MIISNTGDKEEMQNPQQPTSSLLNPFLINVLYVTNFRLFILFSNVQMYSTAVTLMFSGRRVVQGQTIRVYSR